MFADSTLMSPDFDEDAYLRYALHATNGHAERVRLAMCAKAVREEVHKILSENAEDMVRQVTAACRAQRDVAGVRQATASLVHSISKLRNTVQEPHRVINANIIKLENINAALNTLRSILKFIGLTTRLKSQLPQDLARAARTLHELEELLQTSNITGIEVVDSRMDAVEKAAVVIRTKAQDMLRRGDTQDTSGVAISLQCFFILGSLPRVLGSLMTEQKREVMKSLMRDLDLQSMTDEVNLGNNGSASDINMRTREVIFSRLKSAFTNIAQHTQVVVAVWRVLLKRVDPVTHIPYLSAIENPTSVLGDYWHLVTEKLRERLQAIQRRPNFLAALASDILQYRSLLNSFLVDMRELLELLSRLMEMDTLAMRRTSSSLFSNTSPGGVEQLKRIWLSQVTQEVNDRFAAHVMDRHKERLHYILSKLPSIIPSNNSSRPSSMSIVVDLQRPHVPAAVQVLETRSYTVVATQDVTMYRQDPYALSIVLDCVIQSLTTFIQPVTEAINKWPLPPLPSVSGDTTSAQLLHICVSNACTLLSNDLEALLASLPEELFTEDRATDRWISGVERGIDQEEDEGGETSSNARKHVVDKRRQLRDLTNKFKSISEQAIQPFFKSASGLLLDSISMCVGGAQGQEAAGVGQLQSQIQHFMSHFYYLFDPQTSTLDENARKLSDILIARLIVAVTLLYPFNSSTQQHVLCCLQQISRVVFSFGPASSHGSMGRSTMSLKGQLHQLAAWYNIQEEAFDKPVEEWYTVLATLPPVIARLLLLQRILQPSKGVKKPYTILRVNPDNFVEMIENAVLEQLRLANSPQRGFTDGGTTLPTMMRMGEVMNAVETCFREAAEATREDASQAPMVRWVEKLWALL
ncbi:putative conserved oligomeric Golgi complex subunit 5-like [Trypanosoma theileri]|uniref:Conserved oligomeric Golgi complex subunit 5 n=1 Tax=Trypanosoma theileri TaxID=67003 RepID=A0A1X0NSF9_9TRYP|nr:putative conserved oligomeric Golgi complex subunit 5-like [Trypanosoma theileri]ORC87413.1 putative conserved oligomeric Golgi complex subunit 5-like [Trypanosoma theileri]